MYCILLAVCSCFPEICQFFMQQELGLTGRKPQRRKEKGNSRQAHEGTYDGYRDGALAEEYQIRQHLMTLSGSSRSKRGSAYLLRLAVKTTTS